MLDVDAEYRKINSIKRISKIRKALEALEPEERRAVLICGLAVSRCQFTWSFFAEHFGVEMSLWPPDPNETE